MAFLLNMGNDLYLGTLNAAAAVKPGVFVVPDYSAGTVAIADATSGDGDVWVVANDIDTVAEQGINDLDYEVAAGEKVKIHKLVPGEVFTVDLFNGTPAVGDVVAAGVGGKLEAVGTRTPDSSFTVIEKPVLWGVQCIKCVVND
jgi:hypothetical protein